MTIFVAGERVHVARLGTGIVREVRNSGRYVIELKGRSMVVAGSQLEPAPERRATKAPAKRSCQFPVASFQPTERDPDTTGITRTPDRAAAAASRALDLHSKTVLEALDALDVFLNDALLDGCTDVRVIHGRSGGKLKGAVHERLAQLGSIRSFRLDPANAGVTLVTL